MKLISTLKRMRGSFMDMGWLTAIEEERFSVVGNCCTERYVEGLKMKIAVKKEENQSNNNS